LTCEAEEIVSNTSNSTPLAKLEGEVVDYRSREAVPMEVSDYDLSSVILAPLYPIHQQKLPLYLSELG